MQNNNETNHKQLKLISFLTSNDITFPDITGFSLKPSFNLRFIILSKYSLFVNNKIYF